jgi:Cu-Zn family superoxide dismutase
MRITSCFAMWVSPVLFSISCASQPPAPASSPSSPTPSSPTPNEPGEVSALEGAPDDHGTLTPASGAAAAKAGTPRQIEVPLQAKSGSKLTGKAVLTETEGGVRVVLVVEGIAPGDHGAHVHEKGDCSAPDAESAGGHFNPAGLPHGMPGEDKHHLGDLGNITIGQDGKGKLDVVARGASLKAGDPASFVGRAIIVHGNRDDGGQPTGNAGGRVGCGVIRG